MASSRSPKLDGQDERAGPPGPRPPEVRRCGSDLRRAKPQSRSSNPESTLHRVISVGKERYSVALFLQPNPDFIVECLESCCSEACPPRSLVAADLLFGKGCTVPSLFVQKESCVVNVDGWSDRMAQLLDERDLGVLTSSMSFLWHLYQVMVMHYWNCVSKCVKILERLARNIDIPQEIHILWNSISLASVIDQGSFDCSASSGVARNNVRCRSLPSGDIVVNYNHSDATHCSGKLVFCFIALA
ncbi:AP-2 complex subunit alpha-1 [Platanthera zijinensis]|uniref:AP-2 complex subunit alpha-1 n=1 Tax=Platanthera zijinensis TaxID=2320716 RepID=A0AAP0BQ07_9ASPA